MNREENLYCQIGLACKLTRDQRLFSPNADKRMELDMKSYEQRCDYYKCGGCPLNCMCVFNEDDPDALEQMANLISACADEI